MQKDFDSVCAKLDIPSSNLPHKNSTKNNNYFSRIKNHLSYYDNETYDFVAKFYQKDIQIFDYGDSI
ncbi:MAG: hypothetical protein HQ521_00250 [Bacteroidetes bacterium]|nr:hypothetical protein [Bacteroidota bacterium]